MKRISFAFIALLFSISSFGQGTVRFTDKPFHYTIEPDLIIQSFLDKQPGFNNLKKEEKELLYWINYARQKPDDFCNRILTPFLQQFPELKNSYSRSLAKTLIKMQPVGLLSSSVKLNQIAFEHAKDLGSKGLSISHSSSSGASFQQRMEKAGLLNCVSENIYEGKKNSLEAVILLLIDNGVRNLGHRKNILDPAAKYIGVSFYPIKNHSPYYFSVQNFTCE